MGKEAGKDECERGQELLMRMTEGVEYAKRWDRRDEKKDGKEGGI